MAVCERCWDAAFLRARALGGHQVEHYRDLLEERSHGLDAIEGHSYVSKLDVTTPPESRGASDG